MKAEQLRDLGFQLEGRAHGGESGGAWFAIAAVAAGSWGGRRLSLGGYVTDALSSIPQSFPFDLVDRAS